MGYRSFRDSNGVEWQAWDVIPHLGERRAAERRMHAMMPVRTERRTRLDRRVVSGHRPLLSAGLDGGWLCFEAPQEKRRLTPIPDDWQSCSTAQLEQYCARATKARRVSSPLSVQDSIY
jgi:hypothetical protein